MIHFGLGRKHRCCGFNRFAHSAGPSRFGLWGCGVVGLLGCWVIGLLGCGVVGLWGCWVVGGLGAKKIQKINPGGPKVPPIRLFWLPFGTNFVNFSQKIEKIEKTTPKTDRRRLQKGKTQGVSPLFNDFGVIWGSILGQFRYKIVITS